MRSIIKVLMITTVLAFLLSGCSSSRDIEYDDDYYYCENEIVIIEHPNPVVIVAPIAPIVKQPKRKRRTGGEIHQSSGRKRIDSSYRHRDNHRSSSFRSGNTSRDHKSKVDKRIRNRK